MRDVEGFEKLREELLKKEEQIARLIEGQRSLERLVVQFLLTGQMKSISRVDLEPSGLKWLSAPMGPSR